MNKITPALVVLVLALLACSLAPEMPTAGTASEPFPTERIPSPAPIPITPEPSATEAAPIACIVTARKALHLRDAPSIEGTVIAWLLAGDQLTILTDPPAGGWVKVTTAEGVLGWVNSTFIDCEVTE